MVKRRKGIFCCLAYLYADCRAEERVFFARKYFWFGKIEFQGNGSLVILGRNLDRVR